MSMCLSHTFFPPMATSGTSSTLSGALILGETSEVPTFYVGSCSLTPPASWDLACQELCMGLLGVMFPTNGLLNSMCCGRTPSPPQRTLDADAGMNWAGNYYAMLL